VKIAFFLLLVLVLSSLACGQYVTPTPDDTPAASTRAPLPTPTAERVTATFTPMIPAMVRTAIVRQPLVNIHETAGGPVVADVWLVAGQEVTILGYDETGDWVHIQEPAGWVFIGCLENLSERGCIAE
jgi:hypothetical protein